MDFLITVIGNAVADPAFLERLLDNPRGAVDEWGFRLTKGETKMLDAMFAQEKKGDLTMKFYELQGLLIAGMSEELRCPQRACPGFGCYPPPSQEELRQKLDHLAKVA